MNTETYQKKKETTTGDFNSKKTEEMNMGKINTYQRTFLIVAGSLLALLVLITVAGTSGNQHLQKSTHDIEKDTVALADYQEDFANLALTKDSFGLGGVSANNKGKIKNRI